MASSDASSNMSGVVGVAPSVGGANPAAKRRLGRDETPITPSMFEEILAGSQAKALADSRELIDKATANNANTLAAFGHQIDAKFAEQTVAINEVKERVDKVESRQDGLHSEMEELRAGQARLEASLHLANKSAITREDLNQDLFDRPPDLGIIKISSQKFASKMAVEDAITPWLASCGLARDIWTITGRPSGKRFYVKILQNPLSAAKLVLECLGNLKDENGNWKNFDVQLVGGKSCKLFIGGDESPKAGVQRRLAACLKKALAQLYPQIEEVHYRPRAKVGPAVYSANVPLATLQPESESPEKKSILWNPTALPDLAKFGFDRNSVVNQTFKFLDGDDEPIQWCV